MPPEFQNSQPYLPHPACPDINVLGTQMESLMEWRKDIMRKIDELVADGGRVRLLEHQMLQLNNTMERLTEVMERIEGRLLTLERNEPGNERIQKWVDRGVWAAVAAAAMFIAKKVGLIS